MNNVELVNKAEWIAAFLQAQGEFPAIGKDTSVTIETTKGNYSYKYAALPDILDAIAPALDSNGLAIAQSVNGDGNVVAVETRIYHKAGWVEVFGPLALKVTGDAKAAGSAITYARRYALCAALGIAPDEDDDGTRASETPKETGADAAWRWLWQEARGVFKAWSDDELRAAIDGAMSYLSVETVPDRETADRIFAQVTDLYAKRPMDEQGALPVE